ncbi:hypothetical protein ACFWPX_20190 [Nocardia sp. NPDC058518]|uniref:hypothetical protein n=1 Tax=Nocardia sp. NPDC058518 TaxID=3346534 RepID=UPI00365D4290
MAPTPSAAQQWSGLKSAASGGQLFLAPSALTNLVHASNDARIQVNSVTKELHLIDKLAAFAAILPSAKDLADQFSAKGAELRGILKDHEGILDDIGDTFMKSAEHYKGEDSGSGVDMAQLRKERADSKTKTHSLGPRDAPTDLKTGGGGSTTAQHPDAIIPGLLAPTGQTPDGGSYFVLPIDTLGRNKGREGNKWGLPAALLQNQAFDKGKVKGEDPGHYTYDQCVTIANSILQGNTPRAVAQASADWSKLARDLHLGFDGLRKKVEASKEHWTSPNGSNGADRAQGAMAAYADANDTLVTRVALIGVALEYASEWLYSTGFDMTQAMAQTGSAPTSLYVTEPEQEQKEIKRQAAIGVLRMVYVPGVNATSGVIAQLPDATPPTTGGGPTGPGSNNNNGGGTTNGLGGATQGGGRKGNDPGKKQPPGQGDKNSPDKKDQQPGDKGGGDKGGGNQGGGNQGGGQGSGGSGSGLSGLQSGLAAAQQALQSGLGSNSSAGPASSLAGLSGLSPAELAAAAAKKTGAASKGGGGGSGAGGGGAAKAAGQNLNASKLFPRASAAIPVADAGARAGMAAGASSPGMPMGGMPMGGGGAGAGGGQQKEHKRADYLDSTEHLEEAIGAAPIVARPVVEQ